MYKPSKRDKKGMKYWFRFLRLKEPAAKKIANDLKKYHPTVRKSLHKRSYGLSIRLNKRVEAKSLVKIIQKHKIKPKNNDVFASLLAVKDSDIIGLPEYVKKVLHATHYNLTFSFTYVG
jgi:polyphosphate kinase